ncbi:MAG: DUF58 domain-containing protein [Propionibacteriales bacterium]|nr:DUF58 domain-containing protein [Propionibacteriales bacterium]
MAAGLSPRATGVRGGGPDGRRTTTTATPTWRPSPLTRRLMTMVVLGIGLGVVSQNPTLVAFALPGLLAMAVWLRGRRPERVELTVELDTPRTFEHEARRLAVRSTATPHGGAVHLILRPESPVHVTGDRVGVSPLPEARAHWRLAPTLWGYWSTGTVIARTRSATRAWVSETSLEGPRLTVYPPASATADAPPPPHLRRRLGPHVSRAPGAGVEFAGTREYLPGDSVRRVNWAQSSRADRWMVNEFAQERMADVVVLIDSVRDVGPVGQTTVDRSVRGATNVVRSYLSVADRVGVVAFGSALRWLTPTTGNRHFYRVVETLLQARQARTYVDPSLDRLPLAVLPTGALVVCFSPMLDDLVVEAIRDLRERAHPVVVVDVLTLDERPAPRDELAVRLWRLERQALSASLRRIGIRVVPYADTVHGTLGWLASVRSAGGRP